MEMRLIAVEGERLETLMALFEQYFEIDNIQEPDDYLRIFSMHYEPGDDYEEKRQKIMDYAVNQGDIGITSVPMELEIPGGLKYEVMSVKYTRDENGEVVLDSNQFNKLEAIVDAD